MSSDLLQGIPAQAKPAREFAGFKVRLSYTSPDLNLDLEARYATAETEPIFKPEGIEKRGPAGGTIRYQRGEWKIWEKLPAGKWAVVDEEGRPYPKADGSLAIFDNEEEARRFSESLNAEGQNARVTDQEILINEDWVQYRQKIDGEEIAVEPFDRTEIIDIDEKRPLDQCGIDENNPKRVLGTVVPEHWEDNLGPDEEKGSKLYEIWTKLPNSALYRLIEKLEKERLKLYFPMVFRKGMTIHLCIAKVIRFNGDAYLVMKTYSGPVKLKRPIKPAATLREPIVAKPVLAKPILRKKPAGVS